MAKSFFGMRWCFFIGIVSKIMTIKDFAIFVLENTAFLGECRFRTRIRRGSWTRNIGESFKKSECSRSVLYCCFVIYYMHTHTYMYTCTCLLCNLLQAHTHTHIYVHMYVFVLCMRMCMCSSCVCVCVTRMYTCTCSSCVCVCVCVQVRVCPLHAYFSILLHRGCPLAAPMCKHS